MHALKARVQDGRLILNEPTNLPEGAEVSVVVVDGGELDEALLDQELVRRIHRAETGRTVAAEDVIARLRARG